MSITTSGSPITAQAQSTVPELRLFQMGADGTSAANTVNQFRGEVGFPLTLLSMENRGGLKTDITLQYSSAVTQAVSTFNQAAPTGIVGLGWSLPYETILLDFRGSGSPTDDTYYLATSDGARSRLWPTGRTGVGTANELWTFELEAYAFQAISYSPVRQIWTLIDADGSRRIYGADVGAGDSPCALRSAIKWGGTLGNWTGSSARTQQQQAFVISWNLSKVVNAWGDEIVYAYTAFPDDEVQIGGAGGLRYTRAVYLQSIKDPTGRTLTFNYQSKIYDQQANAQGVTIREYEPPHTLTGRGAWPYQDRYETRYLDSIALSQTHDGTTSPVMTLRFAYSVELLADTRVVPGNPAYLYKRYLRNITAVSATGKLMPGPSFDYYSGLESATEVHRGALKTVTLATGGTIDYVYDKLPIAGTALDLTITPSQPGWVPGQLRFFPGPDAIVLVGYEASQSSRLTVMVYEWNGQWLSAKPVQASLPFTADLATLQVEFGEDCFVLSVTGPAANGVVSAWAVHRVYGCYGNWSATALALPTVGTPGTYQIAAGNNFIVAAMSGQGTVSRWTWDPRAKQWMASSVFVPTSATGEWTLSAGYDFFVLAQYQPSQPIYLSLYSLDLASLVWCASPAQLDAIQTYVWNSQYPKLSLATSQTAAVATYITSVDTTADTFNYNANTYTWDMSFNVNGAPQVISGSNVPFDTMEPVLTSVATPSMVGNAANLIRFDGVDWVQTSMGNFDQGTQAANFIYAGDLAVGVNSAQNVIAAFNPSQNQFTTLSPTVGGQGPVAPTANDTVVTVRNTVFQQQPDGSLQNLGPLLGDAVAASNQAPAYLAYAQQNGTSYVLFVKNGVVGPAPTLITTGSAFVQPGTPTSAPGLSLVGPQGFVSFVGTSLDNATQFTLHRVLEQQLAGGLSNFAVTSVVVADGMGNVQPVYFDYSQAKGTTGPYGLASQYDKVIASAGSLTTAGPANGTTTSYFYNGMDPAQATPGLLYSTLNGVLWKTESRNSQGMLVAQQSSVYATVQSVQVAATGATLPLIGSYARVASATETFYDITPMSLPGQPPLTVQTVTTYNEANGQPRTQQSQNCDARTGLWQQLLTSFVYAYEQYPALAASHVNILTPSVLTTSTVDDEVTAIEAVTWQAWGGTTGTTQWAPWRSFQALTPTATLSTSDWQGQTLPSTTAWRLSNQVVTRDTTGDVQEFIDADGLARSVVLDAASRFVVASFENGSLAQQQVAYLGFEHYESLAGWTLAGTASALASAITSGDASSGASALVMGGSGVAQSSPLACALQVLEPQGQTYLLSCWVKTPSGFATAPGEAALTLSLAGTPLASVAVPDTGGQWQLLPLSAALPGNTSAQAVTLSLSNTRSLPMTVDDLRFSPALASLNTTVYDPVPLTQNASMDATGAIRRALQSEFAQTSIAVLPDNAPVELKTSYLSCRDHGGAFAASDPNSVLALAPRGYAFYQSFNAGPVIGNGWRTATPSAWTLAEGRLNHVQGAAPSICFTGYPSGPVTSFGAALRATPQAALRNAVGLNFGSSLALTWTPSSAAWVLSDSSGTLCSAPIRACLSLPAAPYLAALNAGTLPSDFLSSFPLAGLPLAAGSTVSVLTTGSAFCVDDAASAAVYYLVVPASDPSHISVSVFPRDWALLVTGRTIVFYADGGRVMSHVYNADITPGLALFATDAIGFDNAIFFTQAGVQIQFLDGLGRPQQEQLCDGSRLTARAVVYDDLGRDAIHTQYANVTLGSQPWGAFVPGLAAFDWRTTQMSGWVVTDNPDSGGYPYWRTRFEDSPLGRQVEAGLPGRDYAIVPGATDTHTQRFSYGLNDASFTLAAGKFLRTTSVNADGVTQLEMQDLLEQDVALATLATAPPAAPSWNTTYVYFDAGGNPAQSVSPMGWGDTFVYDFTGNQTSATRANEGTTLTIYDTLGRPRFQLDAAGAAATPPFIRYWKYDVLSRVVEEGCASVTAAIVAGWPQSLASQANDPAYPSATPSSSLRYDFSPDPQAPLTLTALGRLTQCISGAERSSPSAPDDPFSATEVVAYDTRGGVRQHVLTLNSGSAQPTTYAYDNLANVIQIVYPSGLQVGYQTDLLGRVKSVMLGANCCAAYTYDAQGDVASEASFDDAGQPVGATRNFSQAPPGWPSDTAGTHFSEMTEYAPWNAGAPGYYSGAPTQTLTAPRASRGEVRTKYGLDPLGRLASADPVTAPPLLFTYDTNGNPLQMGDSLNTYTTATRDQVQSRSDASGTTAYTYTPLGALAGRTNASAPASNLSLVWDGMRRQPLSVGVGTGATASTLSLRYGHQGRRLQKTITPAQGAAIVKQYLRGAGDDALVELSSDGQVVEWVRGPQGLVQMRRNGTPYFIATDRIGSVRSVIDAQGNLVAGFDYHPFGDMNGPALGSNPALMPYRFAGRELEESGLYDFRARLYDPLLGRFISSDPLHQFSSPYTYAGDEPLVMIDPNGKIAFLLALGIAALVGAVIGAIGGGVSYAVSHEGDFSWRDFGKSVGIGLVTGAVAGAAGFAAGAAASAGAVALGYAANSVAVGIVSGAVGGAVGGAAGQLTANAIEGRNLGEGLLTATLLGAAIGGLTGGVAARLGSGSGGGMRGSRLRTRGRANNPRVFRYVRNGRGRRVWLSRHSNSHDDLIPLVRSATRRNRDVTILSGTHGSRSGYLHYERRFYWEDRNGFRRYNNVRVLDISRISDNEVRRILRGNDEVIAAFCYSRTNRLIQWGLE